MKKLIIAINLIMVMFVCSVYSEDIIPIPLVWPDNEVRFCIGKTLLDDHQPVAIINDVIKEIEKKTNIDFVEILIDDIDRVDIIMYMEGETPLATLGYCQYPSIQLPTSELVSISKVNLRRIIYHETFHTLGLIHEHQRPDRDKFVRINYDNIRDGVDMINFKKFDRKYFLYDLKKLPYDTKSILHYSSSAFTKGRPKFTILKVNGDKVFTNFTPSDLDWAKLNDIYKKKKGN